MLNKEDFDQYVDQYSKMSAEEKQREEDVFEMDEIKSSFAKAGIAPVYLPMTEEDLQRAQLILDNCLKERMN